MTTGPSEPNRSPQPIDSEAGTGQHEAPRRRPQEALADTVGVKEDRKIRARQDAHSSVWFGFGMFGIIGWSVAVPAVACIALGVWIDTRWPSPYSWTLMLLFVGVILGCLNAWYWVARERKKLEL